MNHFFDVGANIGQTFTRYLNLRPEYDGWTVWCFEPSPRHLGALRTECLVQSSRYNINLCPFGLCRISGHSLFYEKVDKQGDSFSADLAIGPRKIPNAETTIVSFAATAGVEEFLQMHTDVSDTVVLKLDCEGMEYGILYALMEQEFAIKRIQKILVEWHGEHLDKKPQAITTRLENEFGIEVEIWV